MEALAGRGVMRGVSSTDEDMVEGSGVAGGRSLRSKIWDRSSWAGLYAVNSLPEKCKIKKN